MNYLAKLEKRDGIYVVSSRVIANQLGKRHGNVIRDLESILGNSENSNLSYLIIPNLYRVSNQNRTYREYLLTKDGFTLYMFNIQGYIDFKMAYINKFNEMEKELKEQKQLVEPRQLSIYEAPTELIDAIKAHKNMLSLILDSDKPMKSWRKSLSTIEKFLIDLRELVVN